MADINIKSSTIEKGLESAKEFLQKIVGPSLDELGLLLSDNVKMWRLKNQLRNLEKIKHIVDRQKVNIKNINLKILLPYLENVSLEDDETIQDIWANLIVNYIDADKFLTHTVFPNILAQISSDDVKVIKFIDLNQDKVHIKSNVQDINSFNLISCLSNLERLGIVREDTAYYLSDGNAASLWRTGELEKKQIVDAGSGLYRLTTFGRAFLEACKR